MTEDQVYPEAKEAMWEVHRRLAHHFLELLQDEEADLKAATLNVLRQFLSDNGVRTDASRDALEAGLHRVIPDYELPFPVGPDLSE